MRSNRLLAPVELGDSLTAVPALYRWLQASVSLRVSQFDLCMVATERVAAGTLLCKIVGQRSAQGRSLKKSIKTAAFFSTPFLLIGAWTYWASHGRIISSWFVPSSSIAGISSLGAWGDSFGGFNALVSAVGLSVVLATLWIQASALREQADDTHRQRFESSFFELLSLLRELRKELRFKHTKDYVYGKTKNSNRTVSLAALSYSSQRIDIDAVAAAVSEVTYWLVRQNIAKSPTKKDLVNIYMRRVSSTSERHFSPYFRIIYTILARIRDDKILRTEEKYRYSNLLRSQLTSSELTLLALNGLTPASKDMAELITQFRMLKYLPVSNMRRRFQGVYPPEAFSGRDEPVVQIPMSTRMMKWCLEQRPLRWY